MSVSQFPTPFNSAHSGETVSGPIPNKAQELKSEYPSNVFKQMVDGGGTYGADTTNRVRRFRLFYEGLVDTDAKKLDDHYAEAKDILLGFNFRWQRASATTPIDELLTDVHYESFVADHAQLYKTTQTRTVILVKRPA